ncbi:hypothetical protein [Streptomyces sp. JW3]|uniref:hypothetical protein n=1 Tax=Streptomyces sp. JW3 TaxID=3456955 RepID=UPI003FA4A1DC
MGTARTKDAADLSGAHRPYKASGAYQDSKLHLNLFSAELQRRLTAAGRPVRSLIAHPGIATTGLMSHSAAGKLGHALLARLNNDAEHGALPTLYAACQDLPGNSYVGPDRHGGMKSHPRVGKPSTASLDQATAARLWTLTAELTGVR